MGGIMEDTRVLLGARIKEIRKAKQFSQEQLSDLVGISPKHLSRIEMGRGYPSIETLDKIGSCLNVELKDFFDFDNFRDTPITADSIARMFEDFDEVKKKFICKIFNSIKT
jgi:transcriptional regulator with XRE-family HTH domain